MLFRSTPTPDSVNYFQNRLDPPPTASESWFQIRGLSFKEPLVDGAAWDKSTVPGRWKDSNIGFRCVQDPPH